MAVDRCLIGGLGLGPGDSCHDPNHPWYLPNFMDDALEQACVATQNATPLYPPSPVVPRVPSIGTQKAGTNVTPEQAAAIIAQRDAETAAANKSQIQKYFDDLAAAWSAATPPEAPKPCSWYQTKADDDTCTTGGILLWSLILGGGVVVAVVMAKRR